MIVIIGENRSFDHVFATYVPKKGETVCNLLSEGIVKADGTPGPNFSKAEQRAATDTAPDAFLLSPPKTLVPGTVLPAPLVGGPTDSYVTDDSLTLAQQSENGLPADYYGYLVTGGTGLTGKTPDTRITNVTALPAGPFQLTNGDTFTYNAYAASPVHRFYQMWQQLDCSVDHATADNPSGCDAQLVSLGGSHRGRGHQRRRRSRRTSAPNIRPAPSTTGEGSTAMGFYNVQNGDAPYFKTRRHYAMSDNFHQSVNGGTGANHIMLGHGDAIWFSDGNGHASHSSSQRDGCPGTPNAGIVDEVENPNPAAGTNNWYTEDGYGGGSYGSPSYGGGSYTNCSDTTQPGVAPIVNYLQSLPTPIDPQLRSGPLLPAEQLQPGLLRQRQQRLHRHQRRQHRVHHSAVLHAQHRRRPDRRPTSPGSTTATSGTTTCPIRTSSTTAPSARTRTSTATSATRSSTTPRSWPTPQSARRTSRTLRISTPTSRTARCRRSPSSSRADWSMAIRLLRSWICSKASRRRSWMRCRPIPSLWKDTAIFITFDEGGGYYDSGYVQPLDFFGDGTRIPLIVVSPYAKAGHISHDYADHVSILKFIERTGACRPITSRSRDNFPNPVTSGNPYVPVNSPALDRPLRPVRFH